LAFFITKPVTIFRALNRFRMSKTFTRSDVASHSKPDDLWIIISSEVFNISTFQHDHPGGNKGRYLTAISLNAPGKRKIPSALIAPFKSRLTICSLAGCRREGCYEEVQEVSQRRHPQQVQRRATSRLSRCRCGGEADGIGPLVRVPTPERQSGMMDLGLSRLGFRKAPTCLGDIENRDTI
jgi:hypothetical protein